jgi:hypothetical protein
MSELTIEQKEVQALIENLIRVASRNKVIVAGFAFAAEPSPMIFNFGNCGDAGDIRLYELLIKTFDVKRAQGGVTINPVTEVN